MSELGRMHEGPATGTYLITVELPVDTPEEKRHALETAIGTIAKKYIPGAYLTGHRVMELRGKHGFPERSDAS